MNENISVPKQQRSIEKRNKIKEAGFKLICEKGYFNTNTVQIAKEAGVSTGIVYRYFKDKKQIFLEGIMDFFSEFFSLFDKMVEEININSDFNSVLTKVIDEAIEYHVKFKKTQDEMSALGHYDDEFGEMLKDVEEEFISKTADRLCEIGFSKTHIHEKIHIIFSIVENYVHEVSFSKQNCKDYDYMKDTIVDMSIKLIKSE